MSNTDIFTRNAQAALARGFAIHPLKAGSKFPATRHGFKDATHDDQERLALWMNSSRSANVGIATGEVSGIWVLDVDKKGDGFETLGALHAQNGTADHVTYTVLTPNGGAHYYYRWDPARPVKNKVRFAAGLDTRGNGGYVVAAGSVVDGKTYDVVYDGPVVPAPAWLMDLVAPLEQPSEQQQQQPAAVKLTTSATRISAWVERCINEEAAALAKVASGGRNNALNKAAFRIGQVTHLVPGSEAQVEAALRSACEANGLIRDKGMAAFEKSMASGLSGGKSKPRQGPADKPASERADWEPSAEAAIERAGLPVIRVTPFKRLRDLADEAMAALKVAGGTYVRGGLLVQIWKDEFHRVRAQMATKLTLRARMERVANFERITFRTGEINQVYPPEDLTNDILSAGMAAWPFDGLDGIMSSPAMRPDGTVITEPGYDLATKLYYWPEPGFNMPPLPEAPTQADAETAAAVLDDLIKDFPFRDQASRDNALAFMLTLAARPAITGPTPLFVVNAPQQGSGKTLLAQSMALAVSGVPLPASTAPNDPDEFRKRITVEVIGGAPVVLIDNVVKSIENEHLAGLITAGEWKDRPLGTSTEIRMKVNSVWVVTGNSIRIGGDLIRRCVAIELDAQMSRPWERSKFTNPDLMKFVKDNRGDFPWAALTMLRAWHLAGRPKPPTVLGSFESWATVVGGAMHFAGRANLLGNASQFQEEADDSDGPWETFMLALQEQFKDTAWTPIDIYNAIASPNSGLVECIPAELIGFYSENTKNRFVQRLGYGIRERRGKRHGLSQIRIEHSYETTKRHAKWRFYIGEEKTQA